MRATLVASYAVLATQLWFVTDDAYITFRYAKQWARGLGPRFNATDGLPVEGYSNFLWLVISTLSEWLGHPAPETMPWLSIAAGMALVWLVGWIARRMGHGDGVVVMVTAWVALFPPMLVWGTSGLATMPLALGFAATFAVAGLAPAHRMPAALVGVGIPLVLMRVEGIAWFLGALGVGLAYRHRTEGQARMPRSLVWVALAWSVWFAWRWWFYKMPLPNTVYVKVSPSTETLLRGAGYVLGFFLTMLSPFAIAPAAVAGWRAGRRPQVAALVVLAGAAPAYATFVSGDFMTFWRFLVPSMPFMALLGAEGLTALVAHGRRSIAVVAGLGALVLGGLPGVYVHLVDGELRDALAPRSGYEAKGWDEMRYWMEMRDRADDFAYKGRLLHRLTKPGESYVGKAIGGVGYFALDLLILDVNGLVDRGVRDRRVALKSPGHDRAVSIGYFLDQQPNILYFRHGLRKDLRAVEGDYLKTLLDHNKVLGRYYAEVVPSPDRPFAAVLWVKRSTSRDQLERKRAAFDEFLDHWEELAR